MGKFSITQKIGLAGLILCLVAFLVFFGYNKFSGPSGNMDVTYHEVTSIPGVSFYVPKEISEIATAITEISSEAGLKETSFYSYKNGEDLYVLFCMKRYIFVAAKGTNFNLSERAVEDAFASTTLHGIWFEKTGNEKKISGGRTIDVSAAVSLTSELYGDFYGTLSVVTAGDGTEYSYFAGAVSGYEEESSQTMKTLAASLKPVTKVASAEEVSLTPAAEDPSEESVPEPSSPAEEASEQSPSQTESTEEAPAETPEETPEPETPAQESEPEEAEQKSEEELTLEDSNQHAIADEMSQSAISSVYSMLSVGQTGQAAAQNQTDGSAVYAFVKVDRVFKGEEAEALVQEYIASGDAYLKSYTPPTGCHIEVAEYRYQNVNGADCYIDIRMCGMDGEKLVYEKLGYSKRTYEIPTYREDGENDWITKNYVFYVVPDGCSEYVLQVGGVGEGNEISPAWFHVKEANVSVQDPAGETEDTVPTGNE